jgi:hypothetical protein
MKHVKISYFGFITSFFLAIQFLLFSSFQAFYHSSTLALGKDISNKKLQSSPENTNLIGTTIQNNDIKKLIISDPFNLSNDTLFIHKILLIENANVTTNREVQFFVKRGLINASLVTYNVGNYVKVPNYSGSSFESNFSRNSQDVGSRETYAKGFGIFLAENGHIIKWDDDFDQIIKRSKVAFFYITIIFFSYTDSRNNTLSFLTNQVGLYEISINSNNIANTDTNNYNITTTTTTTTIIVITITPSTNHRIIRLWP